MWITKQKHFSASAEVSVPEAPGNCGAVQSSCLSMHKDPKEMKQCVSLSHDHLLASSPASISETSSHRVLVQSLSQTTQKQSPVGFLFDFIRWIFCGLNLFALNPVSAEHANVHLLFNEVLVECLVNTFRMGKCVCAKALSFYREVKIVVVCERQRASSIFCFCQLFFLCRKLDFSAANVSE